MGFMVAPQRGVKLEFALSKKAALEEEITQIGSF